MVTWSLSLFPKILVVSPNACKCRCVSPALLMSVMASGVWFASEQADQGHELPIMLRLACATEKHLILKQLS